MAQSKWRVVAQYAVGRYEQGEIISTHTTYPLAVKAAKKAGDHFAAIIEIKPQPLRMPSPGKPETLTRSRF